MVHPLSDSVDAGKGRECFDDKIRGKRICPFNRSMNFVVSNTRTTTDLFKLHIGELHAKHNFSGGSADNGYARSLGLYAGNGSNSKRITMLKGSLFAQELSLIADKFHQTSFSEVFRDCKIQPRQFSFPTEALKSNSQTHLAMLPR